MITAEQALRRSTKIDWSEVFMEKCMSQINYSITKGKRVAYLFLAYYSESDVDMISTLAAKLEFLGYKVKFSSKDITIEW